MTPDLETFRALAADHDRIVVVDEMHGDLDMETPISLFWKLRTGGWSFLLESVEGGERWARYTCMGSEPRAVYQVRGEQITVRRPGEDEVHHRSSDPLGWIAGRLRPESTWTPNDMPRLFGGMVGMVSYDAVRHMETLKEVHQDTGDLPDLWFMETALTLVWDNLRHRASLVYLAHVDSPNDIDAVYGTAQEAMATARDRLKRPRPALPRAPASYDAVPLPSIDDDAFAAAVTEAKTFVASGDVIQVVLSRRFTVPRVGGHPFAVYRALRHLNPSPYMFYLEMEDTTLVGASPEALVRVEGGRVETRPIAGTRPRGATSEEDKALEAELVTDPKERAEHVMLVDLGRNDIGRVSRIGTVEVAESMVVERYSHVMHLVSHVQGELDANQGASEVIRAVFPAGTLSGAPKIRAMEIIEQLEPTRRGAYGGAVGMIGAAGGLDLAIAIRMLIATPETLSVQAGAGIVWDSQPQSEAQETRHKAMAILRAIQEAGRLYGHEETP